MAIVREDVQGEPIAPKAYEEFLLRVGGKNPFGEPNYRLVHTASRRQLQGGAWKEWDEALSLQERGGMVVDPASGLVVPSTCKPNKIVKEMRWVLKYVSGFEGWLLERWMPASHYGARDVWNHLHLPEDEDILLLGPYPSEGDYECCSEIVPELPAFEKLHEAIKFQAFCQEHLLHGDVRQRVIDRVTRAAEEYEQNMEKQAAETEYLVKEFLSPWTSTSLGAGRWRQEMADRAGVREHAGN